MTGSAAAAVCAPYRAAVVLTVVAIATALASATSVAAAATQLTQTETVLVSSGNGSSPSDSERNPILGYGCALVSVVFFGSKALFVAYFWR